MEIIIIVIAVIIIMTLIYNNRSFISNEQVSGYEFREDIHLEVNERSKFLTLVNKIREQENRPPLKMDKTLNEFAEQRAGKFAFLNQASAKGFYIVSAQLVDLGVEKVSENVGYSSDKNDSLITNWLTKKGHRKIVLGDWTMTGVGICSNHNNGRVYYCQLFAR